MTSIQLLKAFSEIDPELLESLESGDARQAGRAPAKRMARRLLLAALIALLLVGCAAVYALNLNGIRLGNQVVTQEIFDFDSIGDRETVSVRREYQVLTLAGLRGTPAARAAAEWYAFREGYDPDGAIQKAAWESEPVFPQEYRGYGLYSQEMKNKLDEILAKYGLKLRGCPVEFRTTKLLLQALGIENVLNDGSTAPMRMDYASFYENGALDVYFSIALPCENGTDLQRTKGYLYYRGKDCFIPDTAVLTDAAWEEWNYTTAAGDAVLILRSEETGSAWIFCDMEEWTASLRLDTVLRVYEQREDNVPTAKFEVLSAQQLEQIADAIRFSLKPGLVEGWESLPDYAVPAGQEINGYRIEPVSAFTDGYGYQITLRITAPEGVTLADSGGAVCVKAGNGVSGRCKEDGDGKENTCNFILSDYTSPWDSPADGSLPYPEGYVIPVYWEDLYASAIDYGTGRIVETLLTEGTWAFDIALNEADTREVELLSHPITAKASIGWKMDGGDVLEDLRLTSVKLRSLGLDLTGENQNADFLCFAGQSGQLVLLDGSRIQVTIRTLEQPIDLEQVAYLQLADGTILAMPWVAEETVQRISDLVRQETEAAARPVPTFAGSMELLTQPITMKHLGGYASDETGDVQPLYEYLAITSILLHPNGLAIMGPAAFDGPDAQATVVMKDGTQILLNGLGGEPYCDEPMSQLVSGSTMDLAEADYVILPDGTKISVPGA